MGAKQLCSLKSAISKSKCCILQTFLIVAAFTGLRSIADFNKDLDFVLGTHKVAACHVACGLGNIKSISTSLSIYDVRNFLCSAGYRLALILTGFFCTSKSMRIGSTKAGPDFPSLTRKPNHIY